MHEAPAPVTTITNERLQAHRATLLRFSEAWARGDVEGLLELMNAHPVYRSSSGPGPGACFEGRDAVRAAFERMLAPQKTTTTGAPPPPQMYFFEDRALVYWHLTLAGTDGKACEVDGVDVITFDDDGKIAMKDAYRKAFS